MNKHWHRAQNLFTIQNIEVLTGQLGHIANTSPWLRFMMSEVYTSIKASLKLSEDQLVTHSNQF